MQKRALPRRSNYILLISNGSVLCCFFVYCCVWRMGIFYCHVRIPFLVKHTSTVLACVVAYFFVMSQWSHFPAIVLTCTLWLTSMELFLYSHHIFSIIIQRTIVRSFKTLSRLSVLTNEENIQPNTLKINWNYFFKFLVREMNQLHTLISVTFFLT